MITEQYGFNTPLDFLTNVTDWNNILQVIPSCNIIDLKPGIRFSAYGLTAPNFENLSITITQGDGIVFDDLDSEFDCLDFYVAPQSDQGQITITDTKDTYIFSWKKIEDSLFQFTTHYNDSVFFDSINNNISPASVNEYQEKLIQEYNDLDNNHLLIDVISGGDPQALYNLKSFLFKKMKKAQTLKN
jgi:hypothetical protein